MWEQCQHHERIEACGAPRGVRRSPKPLTPRPLPKEREPQAQLRGPLLCLRAHKLLAQMLARCGHGIFGRLIGPLTARNTLNHGVVVRIVEKHQ